MLRNLIIALLVRVRSFFLKRKLSNKNSRVEIDNPFLKISIIKEEGANFLVNGTLKFHDFVGGGNDPIQIYLAKNSTFLVSGDFMIGPGVKISIEKNGFLKVGGKGEFDSGITCNSRVMVSKKVEIGKDFGCAWGVFITDSDWHYVEYDGIPVASQSDVIIGDHVWICPDCSILKGTVIGDGCIVGTKSLLSGKAFPANSLVAGIPAKIIKNNCFWQRELPKSRVN
jgi:acetyltransferase-like isoleucine patch superfamily enzyme